MTKREELMYRIMGELYSSGAPIVFKGALVTRMILGEAGYDRVVRETKDLDANWTGDRISMETLREAIEGSVQRVDGDYEVAIKREYSEGQSAGFLVRDRRSGENVFGIDMDVKRTGHYRKYIMGEVAFNGVTVDQIICDKICALSGERAIRRIKDMVDIYALSNCVSVMSGDVIDAAEGSGRTMGGFGFFLAEKAKIRHAYDALRNVRGKPDFETVYGHVSRFIKPFLRGDREAEWDPMKQHWIQAGHPRQERPSLSEKLKRLKKTAHEVNEHCGSNQEYQPPL